MDEVDLKVKLRKTDKRIPVVLDVKEVLRRIDEQDRASGLAGVALPGAFELKDRRAGEKWPWQWFFPAKKTSLDPRTGVERRYHVHEETYSRAVRRAVEKALIDKRATTHAFRNASVRKRDGFAEDSGFAGA